MNIKRDFPRVTVTEKCRKRTSDGHPWIYDNEITAADEITDGALADVISEKGRYIGTGFFNSHSKIRVRIISRNANDTFDDSFFKRRLEYAYSYRKTVMTEEDMNACRLIFGEADGFPGLTVDKFNDLLSVQILSLGIEQRRDIILNALLDILRNDGVKIRGVYLRNDVNIRTLEGMSEEKGWYFREGETSPVTEIVENGIRYRVDVENGQKTGFFLDQKYNRRAAASIARGKNVIDCCTHTGSFALNCAKAGAAHVTAVDVSAAAVEMARSNAVLNGLESNMDFVRSDVFDFLKARIEAHDRSADYIILDPPAFTKSRKTVGNARNGYLELNTLAMRLLPRGGYLATASCSHFMKDELFADMLKAAAKAAGVDLRLIELRRQAPDHPILMAVDETEYLKFFLLQII
ncbi:MAG: class I SAM-dependent rRNA methyltransferase [Oscillospiraceae bacterium]|nr:class I SAM-dependent rRNA methyltransferase [Oscillospiraceae bacterium]MCI7499150.1 class I SAM-dependent rRNA methyltransferase [Oscillospiraceae bacterium]MDY2863273.1 class I SAM-dependent rRNA methyltransferase [Oscillospiraceae bacterium]